MRGVIFKCFPKTAFNEEQCRFTTKSKSIKKTLPIVASHQQTPGNILSYSLQRALCVYNLMLQTNLLFFFFFFTQAFPLFLFFYDHSLAPLPLKKCLFLTPDYFLEIASHGGVGEAFARGGVGSSALGPLVPLSFSTSHLLISISPKQLV